MAAAIAETTNATLVLQPSSLSYSVLLVVSHCGNRAAVGSMHSPHPPLLLLPLSAVMYDSSQLPAARTYGTRT